MSSVESLCDDITLINKSQNILTGSVAEIRSRLGANRYRINFEGNPLDLMNKLGERIVEQSAEPVSSTETSMILKVTPDLSRRELLKIAADAVDVTSFGSALPSMDEIFISTVEQFNERSK